MDGLVAMQETLWSAALRELDPMPQPLTAQMLTQLTQNDQITEIPRPLVVAVAEYLSEDLVCDHGVNICVCGTASIYRDLMLALDGEMCCPHCGGEGINWSEEQFLAETQKLAYSQGLPVEEVRQMTGDLPGNITCVTCNGHGAVQMEKVA